MAPPHFFDLPRELRDLIYHHIWLDLPHLVVPYVGRNSLVRYGWTNEACAKPPNKPRNRMEKLPPWLFLNRLFHEECIAVLLERFEWIWLPRGAHRPYAGSSVLFGPGSAHVVTLKLRGSVGHPTTLTAALMKRDDEVDFDRIAEDMIVNEKARALHLWIDLHHGEEEEEDGYIRRGMSFIDMDFRFLWAFRYAHVKTLVIYVWDDSATPLVLCPNGPERQENGISGLAKAIFDRPSSKLECEKSWKENYASQSVLYHWYRFDSGWSSQHKTELV